MDWNPEPLMSLGTFLILFFAILIIGSGVIELILKYKK